MTERSELDTQSAHEHFSGECFNKAWDLMEKPHRTPFEDSRMIQLSLASLWHWTQREDCTNRNLSVGYWQASRIYSILGQADNAREYARRSLELSSGEQPFYVGYAYEALARAEHIAGDTSKKQEYLSRAEELIGAIKDPEEKKILLGDIETMK